MRKLLTPLFDKSPPSVQTWSRRQPVNHPWRAMCQTYSLLTPLHSLLGVPYSDGTKISNDLLKASSGRLGLSAYRAGIVYACRACALSQM